mgnify:CR=1 FL=1
MLNFFLWLRNMEEKVGRRFHKNSKEASPTSSVWTDGSNCQSLTNKPRKCNQIWKIWVYNSNIRSKEEIKAPGPRMKMNFSGKWSSNMEPEAGISLHRFCQEGSANSAERDGTIIWTQISPRRNGLSMKTKSSWTSSCSTAKNGALLQNICLEEQTTQLKTVSILLWKCITAFKIT